MDSLNKRGIFSFLIITFALAWGVWGALFLAGVEVGTPLHSAVGMIALFAPAIGAFIARKWITREGFSDVGWRLSKKALPYFLLAWLLPLVVIGLILLLTDTFNFSPVSFSLSHLTDALPEPSDAPPLPEIGLFEFIGLIMISSIPSTFILFGEEFGWRGYFQKRLFVQSPWKAAIVTGLIWGVWHFPINLQGYNYPDYRIAGLVVFPVACIFLSYIFDWFYRNTRSIWAPCFSHAAFNSIAASLLVTNVVQKETFILTSVVGVLGVIVLAFISLVLHLIDKQNEASIRH